MKKFYYILCLLLPVLAFVGCTDESLYDNDDEQITLSYKVTLDDEAKSRAIGDGSNVNQLLVGIFQNGTQLTQQEFTVEDNKANVTLQLLKNQDYQLVFWAQTKDNGVYNTGDLSNITIDYSNFEKKQVEATNLDAFYATRTVSLKNPGELSVTLTRPFTQFGIGVYGNDVEKDKITSAEIKIKGGLYTAFKPLAEGEKAVYGGNDEEYTFKFTELNDKTNTFVISDKEYTLLTTNYFLVPTAVENPKVSGSVSLKDDSGNSVSNFDFTEAPLVLNARVNIGKGLTEVWDGVYVEALPNANNDGIIHIENTQQLAYLIKYGLRGTAESPAKVHLCKDLDMDATTISRAKDYGIEYLTFDGDGNTLYRLGTALFGNAKNITVTNLNIESSIIEDTGHVGIVADTLKGNCTLQDIIIKESTAKTTAGAAGGMVGYIVRNTVNDRNEPLTVTFSNCDLVGVTANGTQSEGKFVGLLSGYDNGETLAFDAECSAENTSVADYTSPYKKENQSVWITEDLADTYDGWLGTETYRRGVVKFNGVQLVPKWDGTAIDPLLAKIQYDGDNVSEGDYKYVVYSPFDLAGIRTKTASPSAIYLKTNVDMNGQGEDGYFAIPSCFSKSYLSTDDNNFTQFTSVSYLDGNDYTIYNLGINITHDGYNGAALIGIASGTTIHKNLKFDGANIRNIHDSQYASGHALAGNAYAGTLIGTVDSGTYEAENIEVKNGFLFGVCKMGGIIGRTMYANNIKITQCCVDNYYIENYDPGVQDDGGFEVYGEVGGLVGFIRNSGTITQCSVTNTTLNCKHYSGAGAVLPGRHVNNFIGDIRTPNKEIIKIISCNIDNNKYLKDKDEHREYIYGTKKFSVITIPATRKNNSACPFIGMAYYVWTSETIGTVYVDDEKVFYGE